MSDRESRTVLAEDIVLSQADARPMYRQIQDRVRELVASGDWPPGAEMPSIRQLAIGLRVSVITVKRAYLELDREGVIQTRQGKGSVVAENPGLGLQIKQRELDALLERVARLAAETGDSVESVIGRLRAVMAPDSTNQDRESHAEGETEEKTA
ncbi:MAG: GntR family transcriptional regulator [Acidobacteriota bacterium]